MNRRIHISREKSYTEAEVQALLKNTDIDSIKKDILDAAHPIGDIYISTVSTSPAALFGGTWERIYGRFLLASSSTYTAGSTGGEAEHTLNESELPNITGSVTAGNGSSGETGGGYGAFRSAEGAFSVPDANYQYARATAATATAWGSSYGKFRVNMSFGGGQAHNNMPPYLAVYIWKRTA